ncbi:Mu transposase C-terminal domain-containing protein, partial [Pseudoalteromonas nigrifaciens]|uniref:Mu transposase C-terminal domain-containing protein n=1 Tax=Pseudoalteromonas nigrifaciens TaxID=28109 RepID=UPI001D01F492
SEFIIEQVFLDNQNIDARCGSLDAYSAMEALSNTVLDKVEYCKQFDIDITKEMWPTVGLPESIIGDRGEILGRHIEVLSKAFNVNIENTPPYRADWKGIVERYFKTVQVKMKPFVEGYVTKEAIGKKRHGKDYRQDSTHTLKEFTQMMIKIVIFYNNEHTLSEYDPDKDKDLPNDLPYNPLDLWEWGIQYRTGRLRRPSPDIVKVNLLPHTEATVTEKGLKLFNCYYTCKEALDWGWFEGNYKGPKKVTVAYDLYSANVIYLRLNDNYATFVTAALAPRSRAYQDLTMWEVWQRNDINAEVAATSKLKTRSGSVNLVNDLETIASHSKASQPVNKALTKSEKVTGIRENKRLERQQERIKKYDNQDKNTQADNVTPLHNGKLSLKSYKLPTRLKDILKSDSDD